MLLILDNGRPLRGDLVVSAVVRAVKAKGKKKPEPERASAADQLQFFADSVNGDKFLPQTMISLSKARELITAGLVTRERMRERGVQF